MPRLVRSNNTPAATSAQINATAPQIRFAFSLASERGWTTDLPESTLTDPQGNTYRFNEVEKGSVSVAKASAFISALKDLPRAARPAPQPVAEMPDGIYYLDGIVYKVIHAAHGSGKQYAKALNIDTARFEYAPGAIRKLTLANRMTREQAAQFGHLYGVCCRCGATLTDETSIALGIGPVCGGRENWL